MIMTSLVSKTSVSAVLTFKSVFENLRFRGPQLLKTSLSIVLVRTVMYKRRFSKTQVFKNALVWTGP